MVLDESNLHVASIRSLIHSFIHSVIQFILISILHCLAENFFFGGGGAFPTHYHQWVVNTLGFALISKLSQLQIPLSIDTSNWLRNNSFRNIKKSSSNCSSDNINCTQMLLPLFWSTRVRFNFQAVYSSNFADTPSDSVSKNCGLIGFCACLPDNIDNFLKQKRRSLRLAGWSSGWPTHVRTFIRDEQLIRVLV